MRTDFLHRKFGTALLFIAFFVAGAILMNAMTNLGHSALRRDEGARARTRDDPTLDTPRGRAIVRLNELASELSSMHGRELFGAAGDEVTRERPTLAPDVLHRDNPHPPHETAPAEARGPAIQPVVRVKGIDTLTQSLVSVQTSLLGMMNGMSMAVEHINALEAKRHPTTTTTATTTTDKYQTTTGTPTPKLPPYYIRSLTHGSCVDIGPNGVVPFICKEVSRQLVIATSAPTGMLEHTAAKSASKACIHGAALGKQPVMGPCDDKNKMAMWTFLDSDPDGPAGTRIRNEGTQLCLDANAGHDKNIMSPCTSACDLRWQLFIADKPPANHNRAVPANTALVPVRNPPRQRILCWILTQYRAYATKATAVNNTWGRDCDHLFFVGTESYPGLNILVTETGQPESRDILWMKTQQAWTYIYENFLDDYDWFWKADDDTFTIMPNLRAFAAQHDPQEPAHFGRVLYANGQFEYVNAFVSGGSGMLLSQEAVRRLKKATQEDPFNYPPPHNAPADKHTSLALNRVGAGVKTRDSRDSKGRQYFITIGLEAEYRLTRASDPGSWLWTYSNDTREGDACCAKDWIGTHYIREFQAYTLYNMLQVQCRMSQTTFPFLESPYLLPSNSTNV